jgi:DNA-directed RNA polymerase subunit RPC12/RpoP
MKPLKFNEFVTEGRVKEDLYSLIGKAYEENGIISIPVGEYVKRTDAVNFISYDKKHKSLKSAGVAYVRGGDLSLGKEIPFTPELKREIKAAVEADLKDPYSLFRDQDDIADDAKSILRESANSEITCKNCGWEWNFSEGGEEPFVCHKCGHDNEELNEDAKIDLGGAEPLEVKELKGGVSIVQKSKVGSGKNVIVVPAEYIKDLIEELKKHM